MGKNLTAGQSVREFYKAFKQDKWVENEKANLDGIVERGRLQLKVELIAEEFFELLEAIYGKSVGLRMRNEWDEIFEDEGKTGEIPHYELDVVETADALADMIYVIHGLAIESGIPLDDVFDEVHASNMSKLDENGDPILADGVTPKADGSIPPFGKILKGKNFFHPNIPGVLFD